MNLKRGTSKLFTDDFSSLVSNTITHYDAADNMIQGDNWFASLEVQSIRH